MQFTFILAIILIIILILLFVRIVKAVFIIGIFLLLIWILLAVTQSHLDQNNPINLNNNIIAQSIKEKIPLFNKDNQSNTQQNLSKVYKLIKYPNFIQGD